MSKFIPSLKQDCVTRDRDRDRAKHHGPGHLKLEKVFAKKKTRLSVCIRTDRGMRSNLNTCPICLLLAKKGFTSNL